MEKNEAVGILTKQLKDAGAKLTVWKTVGKQVLQDDNSSVAEKVAKYTKAYDEVILSLKKLSADFETFVKRQKVLMRNEKEFVIKNISK